MSTLHALAIGTGVAAVLAAGITAPAAQAAQAKPGRDVRASGTCTQGAGWTLKAKPDDGRIEAELEVDSNVAGQLWTVRLSDNTVLVASGSARTAGASGSFEFRRVIANRAGRDTIVAVATHAGQTCRAQVVLAA